MSLVLEIRFPYSADALTPFLIKTAASDLVGIAPSPQEGAPCAECILKWIKEKDSRAELHEPNGQHKDLLAKLVEAANPHVMYEIQPTGQRDKLECIIFPHPSCVCNREKFVPPPHWDDKANFAFSPVFNLRSARYGTPSGNLWLTAARGEAPLSKQLILTHGVSEDREEARASAVKAWMKRAASEDTLLRLARGESVMSVPFRGGNPSLLTRWQVEQGVLGAGFTFEAAALESLLEFSTSRTLKKFASAMRSPMLVVGANSWIREQVPFFLLQNYDLHLFFYPNSTPSWVVGVAALSRLRTDEPPLFFFGADTEMDVAFRKVLFRLLEVCRPAEWGKDPHSPFEAEIPQMTAKKEKEARHFQKLNMWWTHWIYRCPKISLKELLPLEAYKKDIELWREYFKDGGEPIQVSSLNYGHLPTGLCQLTLLHSQTAETRTAPRNINGIGTLRSFQPSVLG